VNTNPGPQSLENILGGNLVKSGQYRKSCELRQKSFMKLVETLNFAKKKKYFNEIKLSIFSIPGDRRTNTVKLFTHFLSPEP
jgi:hypothetical protein